MNLQLVDTYSLNVFMLVVRRVITTESNCDIEFDVFIVQYVLTFLLLIVPPTVCVLS